MADKELTQVQIEIISERATKFLSGASQVSGIRIALDRGGYNEEEHKQGWEYLLELLGYRTSLVANAPKLLRSTEATAELDLWDGENFERSRAALDHRFPDQSAYVFHNLTAKSGSESIGTVRTYLDPRRRPARRHRPRTQRDPCGRQSGRRPSGQAPHPRRQRRAAAARPHQRSDAPGRPARADRTRPKPAPADGAQARCVVARLARERARSCHASRPSDPPRPCRAPRAQG